MVGCNNKNNTITTITKRIPPWAALMWQENHDHNGSDLISSNKQQEEHDHGEKNWPLTFDKNLPPLALNENLEP
jgi:hypothetical protein